VRRLDEGLSEKWSTLIPADGAVNGPVSIIGAPLGGAYLVAWAESSATWSDSRLRIARIECLAGP
jgi:hypothetical protein